METNIGTVKLCFILTKELKIIIIGRTSWCLHNISDCLLETWIEFSQRCPDYESIQANGHKYWRTMRNSGLELELASMAKKDNPQAYAEIFKGLDFHICKIVNHNSNNDKDSKDKKQSNDEIIYNVVSVLKQKLNRSLFVQIMKGENGGNLMEIFG